MAAYVYVIGPDAGPQKIGVAQNLDKRLRSLQVGSPQLLRLHHAAIWYRAVRLLAMTPEYASTPRGRLSRPEWRAACDTMHRVEGEIVRRGEPSDIAALLHLVVRGISPAQARLPAVKRTLSVVAEHMPGTKCAKAA